MNLVGCATLHSWLDMGTGFYLSVIIVLPGMLSGCHWHPKKSSNCPQTCNCDVRGALRTGKAHAMLSAVTRAQPGQVAADRQVSPSTEVPYLAEETRPSINRDAPASARARLAGF